MSLSSQQREDIAELLRKQIRRKLAEYNPETNNMPFHTRLLGKDRMALFSFIHSINTTLGTSVFEQIAEIVARPNFRCAKYQYKEFSNTISVDAQRIIQEIMDDLTTANRDVDKLAETAAIIAVSQSGGFRQVERPTIDLFLESYEGVEYYFDIKTAKPNKGNFVGLKRNMLEWVAIRGAMDKRVKIRTIVAIPYNPYAPKPYERWTLRGLFDLQNNELLVAEEFWNFLGGDNAYEELLEVFEQVGITLRPEIDARFAQF